MQPRQGPHFRRFLIIFFMFVPRLPLSVLFFKSYALHFFLPLPKQAEMRFITAFYAFQVIEMSEQDCKRCNGERKCSERIFRQNGIDGGKRHRGSHGNKAYIIGHKHNNRFRAEKNKEQPPIKT